MTCLDIRPATKNDEEVVFELYSQLQWVHTERKQELFHSPLNDDTFQAFFEAVLKTDDKHLDIGYVNKQPIGYIYFLINRFERNLYYHPRSRIYIEQVVVAQNMRRRGYGSALIGHVIQIAKQLNILRIELDTWSFNHDAKECFAQRGFSTFQEKMGLQL
jgi:GNAT superfamily N-acetyltransferase